MVQIPLEEYLAKLEQMEIDLAMVIVDLKKVMRECDEAVSGEE